MYSSREQISQEQLKLLFVLAPEKVMRMEMFAGFIAWLGFHSSEEHARRIAVTCVRELNCSHNTFAYFLLRDSFTINDGNTGTCTWPAPSPPWLSELKMFLDRTFVSYIGKHNLVTLYRRETLDLQLSGNPMHCNIAMNLGNVLKLSKSTGHQ